MSAKKNLIIYQGSTFKFVFKLSRSVNKIDTPVDLSGAIAKMQIRPSHRSDTLYLDLYEEGYISISDPMNGEITINIPPGMTADLEFSKAVYDIQVEFSDGHIMRVIEGYITLSPEVTR